MSSTPDRNRSRNNTARSGFALALLAGALLGTAILLTLAAWSGHPATGEWLEQARHWQQNLQESLRGLTERL